MKNFFRVTCFLFAFWSTSSISSPLTDASLKKLIAVTEMKSMVNGMLSQFEGSMDGFVRQSLQGKQVSQKEQKAIDTMKSKMVALLKQEYTWDKMEPTFTKIYRESFTEEEVKGMIDFYQTPSGQAVIKKMPIVMQKSMLAMQSQMSVLMPKMEAIQREFLEELKAINKK